MSGKQFFDWQTSGGTDDVMRLVDCLERADVPWCCIGGVAVNHWAEQQMVTRDVDLVIALDAVDRVVRSLEEAGFTSERFAWSVNLKGRSAVSVQLSTEDFYRDFPGRSVPAENKGLGRAHAPSEQAGERLHRHRENRRGPSPTVVEPHAGIAATGEAALRVRHQSVSRPCLPRPQRQRGSERAPGYSAWAPTRREPERAASWPAAVPATITDAAVLESPAER